jgi:hypothetical protein
MADTYLPPNVYTKTTFENPLASTLASIKIPVIIGEGSENLFRQDLELVRGSSASIDQYVVGEIESSRAVLATAADGSVTLGDFDGTVDKFQVVNSPIVTGDGTGTATTDRTLVVVTINGEPVVVRSVSGTTGVVQLATIPVPGDVVRCTYYFDRSDTQVMDNVSAQVPNRAATLRAASGIRDVNAPDPSVPAATLYLHGDILAPDGTVIVPANNVLNLLVDGTLRTITLPARSDYTMAQVASAIVAARAGTLTASTFVNNYGQSALLLISDHSLSVRDGSANGLLGLLSGQVDNRVSTFYVFNRPIVDGTGGGVITTDPSHVVVRVNGRQVIPTAVDGSSGAVTLPQAPIAGATVSIQYYWNTWQDTFDYLQEVGVTQITQCGTVPGSSDYIQGADFVLQDSQKVMWGTASSVTAGVNTQGFDAFNESQITRTLIDDRTFLATCAPVVQSSGGIATDSRTRFQLPFDPTLGNGRDTPLGQSLFQTISNNRIDLPVNRPDVIWAYWGYDVQDALNRGRVDVLQVEGTTITLRDAIPVGANVYATFYYNQLTDETYTVSCVTPGVSGVGQYRIQDSGEDAVFAPFLVSGSKGAGLTGITIEFPSGSELTPDLRYEAVESDTFVGPVEELATVTFASRPASPARYTLPGAGPYTFIPGQSSRLRLLVHGFEVFNAAGLNLASPSAVSTHRGGFFAHLAGAEINYTGGAGATMGRSFTTTVAEEFTLQVDGVDVPVRVPPAADFDITYITKYINECASGHVGQAQAGSANTTLVMDSTLASDEDDFYNGWVIVIGNGGAAAAGTARTVVDYDGATQTATVAPWPGGPTPPVVTDPYYIYNPETVGVLTGATRFNGPISLDTDKHDKLRLIYTGNVSGALSLTGAGTTEINLGNGPFASAAALATEVTTQIATSITTAASAAHAGLIITCEANAEGQLQFSMQLPGVDGAGVLQFINAGTTAADFAILAGLDTAAAAAGGQAALVQGPIARAYECPSSGATKLYDRILLRNRLLPGGGGSQAADFTVSKCGLVVKVGNEKAGLATGDSGNAGSAAVVHPATMSGEVGFLGGQNGTSFQPSITFYDGTGTTPANNVFEFELDGVAVTVTFTASAGGTATALGPASGASNGSVLDQIIDAMAAVPGAPFGNASAIFNAKYVRQEGAGWRMTSARYNEQSRIEIGSGSANGLLGFGTDAVSLRTLVEARTLASALTAHQHATFNNWVFSPENFPTDPTRTFAKYGIAWVEADATGAEFLYLQDAPTLAAGLGTASSVTVRDPSPNVASALFYGTGLTAEDTDGAVGDPALNGFFVVSSNPAGSGSVNTSILNNGVGQDGIIGQTYRDEVTGLTFTILPRGWSTDQVGPWIAYPTGATASFRVKGTRTFTCDANIPHHAIPGLELRVSNTSNVAVDDTALVQTFERSGNEPAIGDLYYVSYVYTKQDFTTQFYTKVSSIESAYGAPVPDNPVSLASYLAMMNGAVLVGVKQVPKETGSSQASLTTYRAAIEELEGVLPGFVNPDILVPMRGDSTDLFLVIRRSCDKMSSMRYRSERTAILGLALGKRPQDAISTAKALSNTRMRLVYPDSAVVTIQDNEGNVKEFLVDGTFVAAALTGSVVSPNYDVATPWTGRRLTGFTRLGRRLDPVEMNLVSQNGVTVFEDKPPFIRVRHGLTTDMLGASTQGNKRLSQLPTIILIADEVQRQARNVLEGFIGSKYLPGILSQVEGRLAMMFKKLVAANIVSGYTGIKATPDPEDPTTANVIAYYSPVFPLLYLKLTFNLRSQV